MRSNALLQIFRRLPPKVQLGVGVVAVIAFGVMWLTGKLPADLSGNTFVNETSRDGERRQASRRQNADNANRSQSSSRRTNAGNEQRTASQRRASNGKVDSGSGDYDYLTLAMSWSPTYCETTGRSRRDPQCSGNRPYAFVLHGLWPQYQKGWPENCARGKKPWIPNDIIRSMLDIMPSRGLIIHEYKKHGTCTGLDAEGYFSLSRRLYNKIKIPPKYVRPNRLIQTSPREVENDFLRANPNMSADMISVVCGRKDRLKELRVCFSRDGNLARCGRNESQKKLCSRPQIRVPPVRARQ